jgi:hypothetical protein
MQSLLIQPIDYSLQKVALQPDQSPLEKLNPNKNRSSVIKFLEGLYRNTWNTYVQTQIKNQQANQRIQTQFTEMRTKWQELRQKVQADPTYADRFKLEQLAAVQRPLQEAQKMLGQWQETEQKLVQLQQHLTTAFTAINMLTGQESAVKGVPANPAKPTGTRQQLVSAPRPTPAANSSPTPAPAEVPASGATAPEATPGQPAGGSGTAVAPQSAPSFQEGERVFYKNVGATVRKVDPTNNKALIKSDKGNKSYWVKLEGLSKVDTQPVLQSVAQPAVQVLPSPSTATAALTIGLKPYKVAFV